MKASRDQRELPSYRQQLEERGTAGSVSIYFIAVTAAFILLTALLIDFARVAAFRKQAELSVKSGVRSVLSSYDPVIYKRYGLFIRGGESANELFRETVEGNVAQLEKGGAFPFLDTVWGATDVTESRPLANHEVFRRQILEDMKYKAPIDLTLELAERFRGVSGAMKEAASTVDLLEKMRKAYERREAALDDILALQKKYGKEIQGKLSAEISYPPVDMNTQQSAGNARTIADIAMQYEDYVGKRQEDEARVIALRLREEEKRRNQANGVNTKDKNEVELEGPRYGAVISSYESGVTSTASSLGNRSVSIREKVDEATEKVNTAFLAAKQANEEMKAILEQAKSTPPGIVGEETANEGGTIDAEQLQSLAELRKTTEQLILDPLFFQQYETEWGLQQTKGLLLANEASAFSSLASSVPGSTGRGQAVRNGAERLQSSYAEYVRAYGSIGAVYSTREATLQAHRSHDNATKQENEKAKTEWSGAMSFLGALTGVSGSPEEKADFEKVKGLYESNREWNQAEKEQAKAVNKKDPSEGRDEAISASGGLLDMLDGSLVGARDQLYFSEYIIARMSRYDSSLVKNMLHGEDAPLNVSLQETEYILYGLNNPAGNIAAAYGEIFAFRLAIRTMEGLIQCRAMGHPLLVLAAALVYGISNALKDMQRLVEEGKVQLSKYIKVDTVYKDYLRLFLLAHGGSANHQARMIAVMEHASGVSFRGAYTYESGEGTASIKLWFFPGLLKVMGRFGDLGGTVKGNRYEATYTAESSYQ
ncbi:hypothetical protein [Cohnella abietis]|uniref:Uncharacterized protein n=1 Tax=Cohnella abietis TaxID=2507935 RepID=A0A3T1D1Z4_9BACL|nr:hypothetical protein [Cohnella abietis]BBI32071.1 hypothetical protein KCTCHS21_14700 [Cohnella abietis]